jgi:hypothetical protein
MNFKLSSTRNLYANMICIHLNTIYVADFIISLINTRTYYIIALTSDVGLEYSISVSNSLLGLMLLSILIHEARDTPSEPILTDNVSLDSKRHKVFF